jgi:hypothetical protein
MAIDKDLCTLRVCLVVVAKHFKKKQEGCANPGPVTNHEGFLDCHIFCSKAQKNHDAVAVTNAPDTADLIQCVAPS